VQVYRYPFRNLVTDYLRALAGLAVGVAVLAAVPPSFAILGVFGSVTLLFAYFGLRTLNRQFLRLAISEEGLVASGFGSRALSWQALEGLRLRFYGTRREGRRGRGGGFMQLKLRAEGISLTLESTLEGFEAVTRRAAEAARRNGLALDAASATNLGELGIDWSGAAAAGAEGKEAGVG
jgi:hypothetical protein